MDCPFCTKEISDQAVACPHCARDVSFLVLRTLANRQDEITTRLAKLEERIDQLATQLENAPLHPVHHEERGPKSFRHLIGMAAWFSLPVLLLIAAHWFIVGVLDLEPRVLRVISILIPLPFGLRYLQSLTATLWLSLLISGLSVTGMLVTTSQIDRVAIVPQNAPEWIEVAQYFTTVALSFLIGAMVGHRIKMMKPHAKAATSIARSIAALLASSRVRDNESKSSLQHRITTIAGWIYAVATSVTAILAVFAAISKFYS